jgi:hypothetical protein
MGKDSGDAFYEQATITNDARNVMSRVNEYNTL